MPRVQYHERCAPAVGPPIQEVSSNSHGFIADSADEPMDIAFPAFKTAMDKIGRERWWSPMTRSQFEASCTLRGANFVGTPEMSIEKILYQHKIFGHSRFLMQMSEIGRAHV